MDNSSENLWPKMNEVYMNYAKSDPRIKVDHTHVENEDRYKQWWPDIVTIKALFGPLSMNEPYVVFATNDGLMMPNKLEVLSNFLDAHQEAGFVSGIIEIIRDNGAVVTKIGGRTFNGGACNFDWSQPMWRRSLLSKIYPKEGLQQFGMGCMDITLFNLATPFTKAYGIPVTLDKQYARHRDTWITAFWRERALRGELME
jgi:hypothetical protein